MITSRKKARSNSAFALGATDVSDVLRDLSSAEIEAVGGAGAGNVWGDGCIPKPKHTTKLKPSAEV